LSLPTKQGRSFERISGLWSTILPFGQALATADLEKLDGASVKKATVARNDKHCRSDSVQSLAKRQSKMDFFLSSQALEQLNFGMQCFKYRQAPGRPYG
jgi:hypothetical protein